MKGHTTQAKTSGLVHATLNVRQSHLLNIHPFTPSRILPTPICIRSCILALFHFFAECHDGQPCTRTTSLRDQSIMVSRCNSANFEAANYALCRKAGSVPVKLRLRSRSHRLARVNQTRSRNDAKTRLVTMESVSEDDSEGKE